MGPPPSSIRSPAPRHPPGSGMAFPAFNSVRGFSQSPVASFVESKPLTPVLTQVEQERLKHYNLDLPPTTHIQDVYDPESRFFSRQHPRTVELSEHLPYKTELPLDRARYLSHIVSHLYISIKALDLSGILSVSSKDLENLRESGKTSNNEHSVDEDFDYESGGDEEEEEEEEEIEDDDEDADGDDDLSSEIVGTGNSGMMGVKKNDASIVVGVRQWTRELHTWLKMKNDMPFSLRESLARVYYTLSLSSGQIGSIQSFVNMFVLLTSGSHKTVLKDRGFRLDYKPLADKIVRHFPQPDAFYDAPGPLNKHLQKLALNCNYFFNDEDFDDIFSSIGSNFSLTTGGVTLSSLCYLLPSTSPRFIEVAPTFFHMWSIIMKTKEKHVESYMAQIFGTSYDYILSCHDKYPNLLKEKYGKHGFLTSDQTLFIFSQILASLNIQPKKFGISLSGSTYTGYSKIIVYNLNGDESLDPNDGILLHLETLLNTIETYLHPSNSDIWSITCSRFIYNLTYFFKLRYFEENTPRGGLENLPQTHKLSPKVVSHFVKLILPKILVSIQSKNPSVVNASVESLVLLCYMEPDYVLSCTLLDVYQSLQSVINNHRLTVVLKLLTYLAKYFATRPIFRCHVTRILGLLLPGIDGNDVKKSVLVLNVIAAFASYIPFVDLSKESTNPYEFLGISDSMDVTQRHLEFLEAQMYNSDSEVELFEIDEELEVKALISSSMLFEEFMTTFTFKLFTLLENLPDQSNNTSKAEVSLERALPRTLLIMFEAMSDELFQTFSNKMFDFISEGSYFNAIDITCQCVGTIINRDPKNQTPKFIELMLDKINEEFSNGVAGKVRSYDITHRDKPMFCGIAILSEIIGNAGSYILNYSFQISILSRTLLNDLKGPMMFASIFIVCQTLNTLTTTRLSEQRLISPTYIAEHGISEKCWGGFHDKPERFNKKYLDFKWHMPTKNEVEFAVQFFAEHVNACFENLDKLFKESKKDEFVKAKENSGDKVEVNNQDEEEGGEGEISDYSDQFRKNLLYLAYSVTGIAYLLDPSYKEQVAESNKNNSLNAQLLDKKLRMLNLSQKSLSATPISGQSKSLSPTLNGKLSDTIPSTISNSQINSPQPGYDEGKITGDDLLETPGEPSLSRVDSAVSINSLGGGVEMGSAESGISINPFPGQETPSNDKEVPTNPAITARPDKIYTSSYYFGNTLAERYKHPDYIKIHRLYKKIGQKLHEVYLFLLNNYANDTKLFKILMNTMQTWFCDNGAENDFKNFDENVITYKFMRSLQRGNDDRKPFTRIALGSRIERYHRQRVLMHASSRFQTKLDKLLLGDLINLSMSVYSSIAGAAQSTLEESMSKIMGSYTILINSVFEKMDEVLKEDDHQRIKSALTMFTINKLKRRINTDYKNLSKYIKFLSTCMVSDDEQVSAIARALWERLSRRLKIPDCVNIINETEIDDAICPPDQVVDESINLLKIAKEKKKAIYVHQLKQCESIVIKQLSLDKTHWAISTLNIGLLGSLNSGFCLGFNPESAEIFVKAVSYAHPSISNAGMSGVNTTLLRLFHLASYDFDVQKLFNPNCLAKNVEIIDTDYKRLGQNYTEVFTKELGQFENSASYFIDNSIYKGWLFWGKELKVIKNEPFDFDWNNRKELSTLERINEAITKDWFSQIIKLILEDNEEGKKFQHSHIHFITMIIVLSYTNIFKKITVDEVMEVLKDQFVADEKNSHIMICEALCGFFISTRFVPIFDNEKIYNFVNNSLKMCLESLSPNNKSVWKIFCYWLPSTVDVRRFQSIFDLISQYIPKVDGEESAYKQAARLSCLKLYLSTSNWKETRSINIFNELFNLLLHPYQIVREQVGQTITASMVGPMNESYPDYETFSKINENEGSLGLLPFEIPVNMNDHFKQAFEAIEFFRESVDTKTNVQEILDTPYILGARTLYFLVKGLLAKPGSLGLTPLIIDYISPFLLNLEQMRDACKLININPSSLYSNMAKIPFRKEQVGSIVKLILDNGGIKNPSWHQRLTILSFVEIFYFRQLFHFNSEERELLFNYVSKLLFNQILEVRELASRAISGMIHCSPTKERELIINLKIKEYGKVLSDYKKLKKRQKTNKKTYTKKIFSQEDSVKLHGATLGLGSLISAFPYVSPPPSWFPDVLELLANNAFGISGVVDKTSKTILSNFKKTRQDTWHIDNKIFSEDQLQDLEGVLRENYFV